MAATVKILTLTPVLLKQRLTWPLSDGSITAPKIKLAVGSTRS